MQKKVMIVIPTYNERDNIQEIISVINQTTVPGYDIEVLVVDSNSPDGTGEVLEKMRAGMKHLHVYHQPQKQGLGRAYLDGFRHLEENFRDNIDAVITMDADFSHHPRYLNAVLASLEKADLVVGSRYVHGGRLENWPLHRRILSRFANIYASYLTGVPLHDLTSGFHCFRRSTLQRVLKYKAVIRADGYAFLIEMKYFAHYEGFKVAEVPIIFSDRTKGKSKISQKVIFESAIIPWKCFFTNLRHPEQRRAKKAVDAEAPQNSFSEPQNN